VIALGGNRKPARTARPALRVLPGCPGDWGGAGEGLQRPVGEGRLAARPKRRRRSLTQQGTRPAAADLVERRFTAAAPDTPLVGFGSTVARLVGVYSQRNDPPMPGPAGRTA